jgi:PAS domain S-box-containing protein
MGKGAARMPTSTLGAIKIAGIYAFLSFIWILFSDQVIERLASDTAQFSTLQTLKGLCFVLFTAGLLFWLIRRALLERHAHETALKQREHQLSLFIEHAPAAIAMFDKQMRYLSVSRRFMTDYDLTEEKNIVGRSYYELFPQIPERWKEIHRRCLAGAVECCEEDSFPRTDGKIDWIQWVIHPWYENGGEVGGIILFSEVITRRKQMEEALRNSEKQYRTLFETNPQPMWIYDLDSLRFLAVNNAAVDHYGYSAEEFLQMTIKDIRPENDVPVLLENVAKVTSGLDRAGMWCHRKKDGTPILVEITSHVIGFADRKAELVMVNDITDRKRAEAEKENLQNQLQQSQKIESVGRLAGGIAHDFNNMLSVIIGRAELARMRSLNSASLPDDLDQILQAAMRSRDITQKLLAFARKQIIAPKVLDLNETVESMLTMLKQLLGENIDLAWQPKENLWPVEMDPSQMDQILANLCINARDAIADVGKMTIETRMVSLDQAYCHDHAGFIPGDFVMLSVSDDGCGMDKETLGKIFEPFFTTKGLGDGTGLGLSMVYGVVKQHNGFINVYSESDEGTTFKIYLPRYTGQIAEECEAVSGELLKGHGETVLVVEDEASILTLIEEMLSDFGYKVLAANSPSEALDLAKVYPGEIHLLITDVVMPEMNGRVLAGRLQLMHPQLKCLYMSGYTENVIAHHGILDKGIHFIQKPFSRIDFSVHIRAALGLDA